MRIKTPFARRAILSTAMLSMALSLSCPQPSQAEDGSLASQIAELMFGEKFTLSMQAETPDDEVRMKQRKILSERLDVSSISDRDLDIFTRVSMEINAEALAAGLRRAYANKLEEFPIEDQENLLRCAKEFVCNKYSLSAETRTFLEEEGRAFVGKKAREIGMVVGAATVQQILDRLKSVDESEFDNRDELIRVMSGH